MKIVKNKNILIKTLLAFAVVSLLIVFMYFLVLDGFTKTDPSSEAERGEKGYREQSQSFQSSNSIKDTGGEATDVSMENGAASDTGNITLYLPQEHSAFKKGDRIYGAATTNRVHYRIIDNARGVIARGELNVVDGHFSAIIENLHVTSEEGFVEVFSIDQDTLLEEDSIEVKVMFD